MQALVGTQYMGSNRTRFTYNLPTTKGDTMSRETAPTTTQSTAVVTTESTKTDPPKFVYDILSRKNRLIDPCLWRLLSVRSPSFGDGQKKVREILLSYIKQLGFKGRVDAYGNVVVDNAKGQLTGVTMFSSHLDTVHSEEGTQTLAALCNQAKAEDNDMIVAVNETSKNSGYYTRGVLGADDKLGAYIMLRLLKAKVRGIYIWHLDEESGTCGSKWIARNNEALLQRCSHSIGFDRKNYGDIIGTQNGRACCSKAFMEALATQLNDNLPAKCMVRFKDSVVGSFTDTANYVGHIPECTNVSVGYFDQHTSSERFDPIWLNNFLIPALIKVRWSELPSEHPLTKKSDTRAYGGTSSWRGHGNYNYNTSSFNEYDIDQKTGMFRRYLREADVRHRNDTGKWDALNWAMPEGRSEYIQLGTIRRMIEEHMGSTGAAAYILDLLEAYHKSEDKLSKAVAHNEKLEQDLLFREEEVALYEKYCTENNIDTMAIVQSLYEDPATKDDPVEDKKVEAQEGEPVVSQAEQDALNDRLPDSMLPDSAKKNGPA